MSSFITRDPHTGNDLCIRPSSRIGCRHLVIEHDGTETSIEIDDTDCDDIIIALGGLPPHHRPDASL